ncbi:protein FAR1-RELATED SEQUENCE 5-like [Spinacia oleracea]|uniref:Protein FAR1-RELATED SEQUENCE 5-like n=1 Tax=Spinacia oleracea TaxID=3562 RepID=A0ABM3RIV6_SPIOL|nr:protein FAR1-RELATED SEQUENCE 5-like [Spinacia oleracea]
MTDQAPAIAAAIKDVFPEARHRLCAWHLGENSKKNIATQRAMKGFTELFSYLLKYCDTVAEFEHYWPIFIKSYKCEKNVWLNNLYMIREHWCRAYSKDSFFGGALSSQRSESTNNSIKDRLRKTDGLCDFYHLFSDEQLLNGISLNKERTFEDVQKVVYLIWKPATDDLIRHKVTFNKITFEANCTCKHFSEVGLLCSHILRIYSIHCIGVLPKQYILKKWAKAAMCSTIVDEQFSKANVVPASVWRFQTMRKFVRLVTSCQDFLESRVEIDTAFDLLRQKACNKKKAWRKHAEKHAEKVNAKAQAFVQELDGLGNLLIYSHPSSGSKLRVLGLSLVEEDICGKSEVPDVVDSLECFVQGVFGSQSKKRKGIYSTCTPNSANKELTSPAARVSLYDEIMANFDK